MNEEILAIQQVRQEGDAMHNERVAQLSQEATMKFQAQEVHMCALRDELARRESEIARHVADRAAASLTSDPTVVIVSLKHKLRESEQREEQMALRSDHLYDELGDCRDQAEFASQQANYDMEGMGREHQTALAAMTKDIDDLMTETQEHGQRSAKVRNTVLS